MLAELDGVTSVALEVNPAGNTDAASADADPRLRASIAVPTLDPLAAVDVLEAAFPCGSVTGAPKVSTARLIGRVEPHARGLYCGAVGVVAPGGDATFSVAIRTLVADTVIVNPDPVNTAA